MKFFGIDPALTRLGWAVIEVNNTKINYIDSGNIVTSPKQLMQHRLSVISNRINDLLSLHQPTAIGMEQTFVNNNAVSSLKLAYVRGALLATIGNKNVPYYEFLPNNIKKTIVGSGHADKEQIKYMVKLIINAVEKDINNDEADALAIAYTCFANYRPIP